MNKFWLIFALIGLALGMVSCSSDNDEECEGEEVNIIGTWAATSGKYNLSLKITASGYDFLLAEPGKGGVTDKGTYELSKDGGIIFENNSGDILAMGTVKNEKLTLTFVNTIAMMMLGSGGAANVVFTLEEESGSEGKGFLVIQNLSTSYDILSFKFYDASGELIDTDTDTLEPDYQLVYKVDAGTYAVEVTDSKDKSYKSKSFKILKDKYTVLGYTGSAVNVLATGIDESDFTRATVNSRATASKTIVKRELIGHYE